jgi:hypothetical protein
VGIFDRLTAAIVAAPLAKALAAEQLASPWADNSHLADITLESLYGYADANVRATRSRAMQIPTVKAGRNTIAGTIARLALYAEKDDTRLPVQPSLFGQLERGIPTSTTLRWTVDALIFYPVAWWVVRERDFYGWPTFIEWVPNLKARVDANGNLVGIGDEDIKPEDVIRFDSPNGSGLLIDGARTIKRAITIEESAALAEDNPVPTMELHNEGDKLTKDEIQDLMDIWQANRRKRGVAYTSKGIKAIAHGTQVSQLLIEGRKALNFDLIRHMSIPAWVAAAGVEGSSLQYENRQSRNWELIDISCAPYMDALVSRLSMPDVTPRGQRVKLDTDELTKPDQKTRFDTYAVGKNAGFVTNEMIAAWEGWATVPEETTP